MGFTPLTGVTMATRSGDVDVSMIAFVMDKLGINSISEMVYTLNKESGLAGISGVSSDMRDILSVSHAKHRARLAIDIFVRISSNISDSIILRWAESTESCSRPELAKILPSSER